MRLLPRYYGRVSCSHGQHGESNVRKDDQRLRRRWVYASDIREHYAVYIERNDHVEAQFAETECGHNE